MSDLIIISQVFTNLKKLIFIPKLFIGYGEINIKFDENNSFYRFIIYVNLRHNRIQIECK